MLLFLITFRKILSKLRIVIYCIVLKTLPVDIKIKKYKIKTVLLAPRGRRSCLTKLELLLWFLFQFWWIIVCNTMLYMIFHYVWEPVLIQRIFTGFEAILEINFVRCPVLSLIFNEMPGEGFSTIYWILRWM